MRGPRSGSVAPITLRAPPGAGAPILRTLGKNRPCHAFAFLPPPWRRPSHRPGPRRPAWLKAKSSHYSNAKCHRLISHYVKTHKKQIKKNPVAEGKGKGKGKYIRRLQKHRCMFGG